MTRYLDVYRVKILPVDIFVLVRTWVPSMHATAVGNPASRRNSPSVGRLVVASVAVPTHASERTKRWSHGGWFGMRVTDRYGWYQPPSSRNKLAYIHNATITCRVAGKEPCRVSIGVLKVV